jgi:hypothetical protein
MQSYSGVEIFNWYYPSSPPQIPRVSRCPLEWGWLIYNGHSPTDTSTRSGVMVMHGNGHGRWSKAAALFWCQNVYRELSQFHSRVIFHCRVSTVRVGLPRAHHRENDLPQSRVWSYLLSHSVLEGRSKKAGLGSSSNPKNCPQILQQKRGSQPFGHLKWPGVGQNELIGGSGGALKAAWLITFSRV